MKKRNMLHEIVEKYGKFPDAIIHEISYRGPSKSKIVEVVLTCMNAQNDYKYEKIKLIFSDVISFRFIENEREWSTALKFVLMSDDNNMILFDFFPIYYSGDDLREDEASSFKIRSKEVSFTRME